MNLKQIDWKYIFLSSLALTFFMIIYMFFTNQFSWWTTFMSILIFPVLGIIISFSKPQIKKTKGCLYNKNQEMKNDYFEGLYNFKDDDLIFLLEQSRDLLEDEFEQFTIWIFDNKYENKESAIYEKPINKKDVLKGLKKGQLVIHRFFEGKKEFRIKAEFIEYRDYGFTAVLKEVGTNKEYLAMGNDLALP